MTFTNNAPFRNPTKSLIPSMAIGIGMIAGSSWMPTSTHATPESGWSIEQTSARSDTTASEDEVRSTQAPSSFESGVNFGYAVSGDWMRDAEYVGIVRRDATVVTPENEMKWDHIHPERGVYDFTRADEIVSAAQLNGQKVRGHALVWHQQLPDWIEEHDWSRGELIEVMREHITTVVGHYRTEFPGVVTQWDVVNEAFDSHGSRRDSIWQRTIGDDYIELAFKFAREADPDALLFYNDYYDDSLGVAVARRNGAATGNPNAVSCDEVPKCASTRMLATELVRRGVSIDGIGFEGHVFDGEPIDYEEFSSWTLPLGLQWALTEIDVALPTRDGHDRDALDAQADVFESMVGDCLASANCNTIVVWGVTDSQSWIPRHTDGASGHAVLYTADYESKPAADQVLAALGPRR